MGLITYQMNVIKSKSKDVQAILTQGNKVKDLPILKMKIPCYQMGKLISIY